MKKSKNKKSMFNKLSKAYVVQETTIEELKKYGKYCAKCLKNI